MKKLKINKRYELVFNDSNDRVNATLKPNGKKHPYFETDEGEIYPLTSVDLSQEIEELE